MIDAMIPPASEIRIRLAETLRNADTLKSLLKVAEKAAQDRREIDSLRQGELPRQTSGQNDARS